MKADPSKVKEIQERGFAVVPNIIPREEVAPMRELLQKCIDEDLKKWEGKDYADRWMVHNLVVRGMPFAHLLENEKMHAYLSEMLGDTCILYAYTSSSMPAGGSNYSHRIHVDCPRLIPGYMTNGGMILALDDFTADNGATYFLPASHDRADPPSEEEFFAKAERALPKAGDGVFLNADMASGRSKPHRSPSPRRHAQCLPVVHATTI